MDIVDRLKGDGKVIPLGGKAEEDYLLRQSAIAEILMLRGKLEETENVLKLAENYYLEGKEYFRNGPKIVSVTKKSSDNVSYAVPIISTYNDGTGICIIVSD